MNQKIFRFQPIYKERIWGGRKFETQLGREIPNGNIGESWELSDYGTDLSIIHNGEYAGKNFQEVYKKFPKEILGDNFKETESFPLLVKIIDAREKLSVQVHPDDNYALEKDPESAGKKESWYIIDADSQATIVCGFKENLSREKYLKQIESSTAEEPLQVFQSKKGDAFIINPGTVHAIGGGNLILEVQQSSDSTYRVYDYGRLGDDGKPRKLHLEKALDVLNFNSSKKEELIQPEKLDWEGGLRKKLIWNDKFKFEILEFNKKAKLPTVGNTKSFQIYHILEGELELEGEKLVKADTFLIPAKFSNSGLELIAKSPEVKLALMTAGSDWDK